MLGLVVNADLVGLVIAVLVTAYLVFALIRPEDL